MDADGKPARFSNAAFRSWESSDIFGPLRARPLNAYITAMMSEIFQMYFADPKDAAFPDGADVTGDDFISVRGTPA
jgi:hypothetical protein